MDYLADELNANFTQVWAIMIFSGRKEAGYGMNTGGAMFMPWAASAKIEGNGRGSSPYRVSATHSCGATVR